MESPKRKFSPEEAERNMAAAFKLLAKRRALVNAAHSRVTKAHGDLMLKIITETWTNGATKAIRKAYNRLDDAKREWGRAVASMQEVEHAIRRVEWAEHEVALSVERERELNRPKHMVQTEYDPNWTVPGPNEILESRKWWR